MTNRVHLELEAEHLDFITAVLQRRRWAKANPILVAIAMQIRAHHERAQDAAAAVQPMTSTGNGAAVSEPADRGSGAEPGLP